MENNVAKVSWNETEGRYELKVLNKLKAYSNGDTQAEHDEAKKELCQLAADKGYTVIEG
jgi:hypothetical protein